MKADGNCIARPIAAGVYGDESDLAVLKTSNKDSSQFANAQAALDQIADKNHRLVRMKIADLIEKNNSKNSSKRSNTETSLMRQ